MPKLPLDDIKARFETGDRPTGEDFAALIDSLAAYSTDLGSEGNNELEINGIENTTVIDSINTSEWRWVKYMVSISKTSDGENKFYATEFNILIDGENVNITEYGVLDSDGDMGTIDVSRSDGTLSIVVTPDVNIRPITARFARIGLKS
jgi:archaellum component FlaF (FlaF/FlaG flagellin family)